MTSDQLGRRYERLLFLSGPLTIVAVLVLLVAFSSTTQSERVLARCLEVAIKTLHENRGTLDDSWDAYGQERKKSKYITNSYKYELKRVWISPGISSGCHKEVEPLLEQSFDTSPGKLIDSFESRISQLRSTPLQFRGIEMPQKADVAILGTNIKISLESLTALLQVSLAPVLMIWLGSLYNTRYRESLHVGKAGDIAAIFPHLINVYPAIDFPSLRKRSRLAYWLPPSRITRAMYVLTRLSLIAFVVLPAIGCYLASLILLPIEGIIWLSVLSGFIVALFGLSVVLVELLPWHIGKIFPGVVKR
jgi:hypothetical protein